MPATAPTPPPPPPPDEAQRRRAVTLFTRNLVVTAGAGTGKTALLVERALNLICAAALPIRSMAAITFTEKAAAELRQRLAAGLDALRSLAAAGTAPDAPLPVSEAGRAYRWLTTDAGLKPGMVAERALAALADLDAASVSTIHAFCADLLRRHPVAAGVDPGFAIDQGAILDRLFEEEWARFLEEELGGGGVRDDLWRRVLRQPGALDDVRALARAFSSFAFAGEAAGAGPEAPALQETLRAALRPVREALGRAAGKGPAVNANMRLYLEEASRLLEAAAAGGPEAMRQALDRQAIEAFVARATIRAGAKLDEADRRDLERLKATAQHWVERLLHVDASTLEALRRAAAPLAGRCRERLLASGFVSFDALLRLARDLLARHPAIRRAAAARHRVLLLDEFQDTDPLQYEIVFFIAEAPGESAERAFEARLAPGRLFIVGDPKQSIYRFRGADIEAYRHAVDRLMGCGGERLSLTASFRSPAAVLRPINRLFSAWMRDEAAGGGPGQVDYEAIEPVHPDSRHSGVEVWSIVADGTADDRRRAEAQAIAAWIAARAGSAEPEGRIAYRHVAILLRALTNAGLYADALRRAGVPYVVEGDRDFYERREVGDLIAFLRAVSDPNDGPSLLAVLRGPLGAVPDEQLARFADAGGRLDRPGASPPDPGVFPDLARALAHLQAFRERAVGRAPDEVVREALTATPLALLHASTFEGAQRLANLRKLVARAAEHARQGLSLQETLGAIESELEGERAEGESPLADETIDAVRLLSVHRAKGLEYPVVFLPDLGRGTVGSRRGAATTVVRHDATGETAAVRLADGALELARVLHEEANRRQEEAEEQRVFYVACTRAGDRLILVNSLAGRAAPWRDALRHLGYDAGDDLPPDGPLEAGVTHRRVAPPPPAALPTPPALRSPAAAATAFAAAAASASAASSPILRWPAGVADAGMAPGGDAEGALPTPAAPRHGGDAGSARAAGTAVHAALERWDFREGGGLRVLLQEEIRRLAAEAGPGDGGTAREAARIAGEVIDRFLEGGLPERLARADVLGRELPILWSDADGTTWIGACDLVYRDADGAVVAVDYKTDRVEGDPARAAERYRPQMRVYLEALRRAQPGARVRGEILFLRSGDVVPIA